MCWGHTHFFTCMEIIVWILILTVQCAWLCKHTTSLSRCNILSTYLHPPRAPAGPWLQVTPGQYLDYIETGWTKSWGAELCPDTKLGIYWVSTAGDERADLGRRGADRSGRHLHYLVPCTAGKSDKFVWFEGFMYLHLKPIENIR